MIESVASNHEDLASKTRRLLATHFLTGEMLMEEEDIRTCCECGEETSIYVCFIYDDDYFCEWCCPDGYGE